MRSSIAPAAQFATATFNQSGGVNLVGGANAGDDLYVGRGGAGTYNLNGGVLTIFAATGVHNTYVGKDGGAGTFNQTAGRHSIDGSLLVGIDASSVGVYNLSAGTIGAQAGEIIGGVGGAGSFSQTGGFHDVGNISTTTTLTLGRRRWVHRCLHAQWRDRRHGGWK